MPVLVSEVTFSIVPAKVVRFFSATISRIDCEVRTSSSNSTYNTTVLLRNAKLSVYACACKNALNRTRQKNILFTNPSIGSSSILMPFTTPTFCVRLFRENWLLQSPFSLTGRQHIMSWPHSFAQTLLTEKPLLRERNGIGIGRRMALKKNRGPPNVEKLSASPELPALFRPQNRWWPIDPDERLSGPRSQWQHLSWTVTRRGRTIHRMNGTTGTLTQMAAAVTN